MDEDTTIIGITHSVQQYERKRVYFIAQASYKSVATKYLTLLHSNRG